MNFGNIALALALAAGMIALVTYYLWARGRTQLRESARLYTGAMALFVVLASVFQMVNILSRSFEYEYVAKFSDRSLPTLLLIATFWGGQAGSFLLWSLWSVLFGVVLMLGLRRSSWEPFVLTPYLLIALCITGIMWASGPFKMLDNPPADSVHRFYDHGWPIRVRNRGAVAARL